MNRRRAGQHPAAINHASAASAPGVRHRRGEQADEPRSVFLDAALPHVDAVQSLAWNLTRNRQDAEDLVQESYLRAYERFEQYRGGSIRAWLATICLNLARSDGRRRARRPAELLTAEIETVTEDVSTYDVAADVAGHLDRAVIRSALDALPEPQRLCILMMDVAGYTAAETGAALNCPRGTVLARVHRGRRRLAQVLAGSGVDHA
jgi:RNA polymerase sigma-70 factor (ECF subfamily)